MDNQQEQISCSTPLNNYDSGNFTLYSNISDSSLPPISSTTASSIEEYDDEPDPDTSDNQNHKNMKTIINNEIEKLKNELEHVKKSEQWYKNEMKLQKNIRLELLERLYLNEHKYIKSNQKLQIDNDRLKRSYKELEQKYNDDKEYLTKKLLQNDEIKINSISQSQFNSSSTSLKLLTTSRIDSSTLSSSSSLLSSLPQFDTSQLADTIATNQSLDNNNDTKNLLFELDKYKNLCKDYEIINKLLRKQKLNLLNDIHLLKNERNIKQILLEKKFLIVNTENIKITENYVKLNDENRNLKHKISSVEKLLLKAKNDIQFKDEELLRLQNELKRKNQLIKNDDKEIETIQKQKQHFRKEQKKNIIVRNNNLNLNQISFNDRIKNNDNDINNYEFLNTNLDNSHKLRENFNLELSFDKISVIQEKLTSLENENNELKAQTKLERIQNNKSLQDEIVKYNQLEGKMNEYIELLEKNNKKLELKDNEIGVLRNLLEQNQIQINELLTDNRKLNENIIRIDNDNKHKLELEELNNKNKIIIQELNDNLIKLNFDMNEILMENENLKKSKNELNSRLENEKFVNINEVEKLKKIIQEQNDKILEQKNALENYEEKLNEIYNQLKFERSEFVRQITEKQESIERQNTETENNIKDESSDGTSIIETESKVNRNEEADDKLESNSCQSSKSSEDIRKNLKCHRVSINLQLIDENPDSNTNKSEFDEHVHNIEMLKTLLAQKSEKMTILCEEQEKWENILEKLNKVQQKNTLNLENSNEDRDRNTNITDKMNVENDYDDENQLIISSDNVKTIEELKEKCIEYVNLLKDKDLEIINKQKQIEDLQSNLLEKTKNYEKLKNDFETFKYRNTKEMEELKENHKDVEKSLKDELNAKSIEYEIFKPLLNEHEKKLKNLKDVLKLQQNEKTEMEENLEFMNQNLSELQQIIEQMELEKSENLQIIEKLENKLEEERTRNQLCSYISKNVIDNECQTESSYLIDDDGRSSEMDNDHDKNLNMKILKKVMESEHRKNITRYELHIRTLLGNIKSYKRNLETMENRYDKLNQKYKKLEEKEKEREKSKSSEKEREKSKSSEKDSKQSNEVIYEQNEGNDDGNLENQNQNERLSKDINEYAADENQQFELNSRKCSKCTEFENGSKANQEKLTEFENKLKENESLLEMLKHQLDIAKKQFLEIDDYKRINEDLKINLTNLMDDYKNILRRSSSIYSSKRNSNYYDDDNDSFYTDDNIMKLIEKSNSYVPNLSQLSSEIYNLKEDVKHFKNVYVTSNRSSSNRPSTKRSPSLAEELKAAEHLKL